MIGVLESLGVKPQERRPVIFVLIGIFMVGNAVWILPVAWGKGPELVKKVKDRDNLQRKNNSKPYISGRKERRSSSSGSSFI